MGITTQQVEEACADIERDLQSFREAGTDSAALHRALRALRGLRGQYEDSRPVLDPYVDRLRDYRRQIQDAIREARDALTGEYLQASRELAAWREQREACRDALIELAEADHMDRLDSEGGWVEVKHVRSMALPEPGTPARQDLWAVIRESGRWDEVAAPSGMKLLKAVDGGLLPAALAARITDLCPVRTVCRLSAHHHKT